MERSVLKRLLEMLSSLGMYTGSFLPPLLEETHEYYRTERQRLMANPDIKDFLRRAEAGPLSLIPRHWPLLLRDLVSVCLPAAPCQAIWWGSECLAWACPVATFTRSNGHG